jgi:hypothetical protein
MHSRHSVSLLNGDFLIRFNLMTLERRGLVVTSESYPNQRPAATSWARLLADPTERSSLEGVPH